MEYYSSSAGKIWYSTYSGQICCSIYLILIFFFFMIAWTYSFHPKKYITHQFWIYQDSVIGESCSSFCQNNHLKKCPRNAYSMRYSRNGYSISSNIIETDNSRIICASSNPNSKSINLHFFLFQDHFTQGNLISGFSIDIFDTIQIMKIGDRFDSIYFHIRF